MWIYLYYLNLKRNQLPGTFLLRLQTWARLSTLRLERFLLNTLRYLSKTNGTIFILDRVRSVSVNLVQASSTEIRGLAEFLQNYWVFVVFVEYVVHLHTKILRTFLNLSKISLQKFRPAKEKNNSLTLTTLLNIDDLVYHWKEGTQ